jgi:hypothetical protein
MNITPEIQKWANSIARRAGYGTATEIIINPDCVIAKVLRHTQYGYRKRTTGEYVPMTYIRNFGWKNTYYQCAETVVELPST